MTIQNRDRFLNKLAENLGRSRLTEAVVCPKWHMNPQKDIYKGYSQSDLVDVLEEQCAIINTNLKRTTSEQLPTLLKSAVKAHKGKKVLASNDKKNKEFGLDLAFDDLRSEGIDVRLWDYSIGIENQVFAEQADIGITFSDVTLAESGTITLFNDKDNGRSISLLPRVHIVVIPQSTLVPRMTQAVQKIHKANALGDQVSSCISFISGPSNSADIEMNLIVGVHGPVEVMYIVVKDR